MKNKEFIGERLLLTYALNIIDIIYTLYFATRFGVQIEGNELALLMWEKNPALLIIFKLFGVGALLLIIYAFRKHDAAHVASIVLLVVFVGLVVYHIALLIIAIKQYGF